MAQRQRGRLPSQPAGLGDFAGGEKSGHSLPSTFNLKQVAAQRLRRQRAVEHVHQLERLLDAALTDEGTS